MTIGVKSNNKNRSNHRLSIAVVVVVVMGPSFSADEYWERLAMLLIESYDEESVPRPRLRSQQPWLRHRRHRQISSGQH
jgi:hypothetical protein